jgi:tripartite-type tricarboxylate transporter receptor subunit TctC
MKKRILGISILSLVVLVLGFSISADAGRYPVRPVKGIVGYGAGGSTDVVFRAITADADKYLGKSIAIVNKKGGGGSVAGNFVAKSKKDGYTLLLTPTSPLGIYPNLQPNPAYTIDDFIICCSVTLDYFVYVSPVDKPWDTVKELVEAAKENPETVRFGSPGVTSLGAFGYYSLHDAIPDVKFVRVPLRGHSDIVAGMLRGDVDVASGTYAGYKAQVDAGKLKPLGVTSPTRNIFLPEVPTLKEQGLDVNIIPNIRYVCVPKGTPADVVKKIEAGFKGMCEDELVKQRIATLNQDLVYNDGAKSLELVKGQSAQFKIIIKKMGLTIKKKK